MLPALHHRLTATPRLPYCCSLGLITAAGRGSEGAEPGQAASKAQHCRLYQHWRRSCRQDPTYDRQTCGANARVGAELRTKARPSQIASATPAARTELYDAATSAAPSGWRRRRVGTAPAGDASRQEQRINGERGLRDERGQLRLQSCTWECGVWEDWVASVAVDYDGLLRDGGAQPPPFDEYLRTRPEITPLDKLKGVALDSAKAKNNAFIAQRRIDARALLRSALARGVLPWGADCQVQYADFSPTGTAGNPIDLLSSDDDSDEE